MQRDYQSIVYEFRRPPELDLPQRAGARRPVVVIGAGPVGLSAAIDLAQQGVPVLVLDDDCRLSAGSRALCFAKRTLEIFDRLGCGDPVVDTGVRWQRGKVFAGSELAYEFDLLPEPGHKRPAFVNLQQYYVEGFLVDRAAQLQDLEIRWKSRVAGLAAHDDGVTLEVDTPEGAYRVEADWVVAADGARSPVRRMMGLESRGRTFRDRFLIADVRMKADFPTERWFWFDPPFHRNQSVLLHKQPDGVWRIDFQLGWDADPEEERKPERVLPRVRALLGQDADFELVWCSVYTFACMRMERFRHGRVLFAGDAAHGVSPFGARGANSGVQDAENLAWKLARVARGASPASLLDSYDQERVLAADENILNSTRSTDFITPKSRASRTMRDAVLALARHAPFARRLVNSGRLSVPSVLAGSALSTPDAEGDTFAGRMPPGAPVQDAPLREAGREGWLVDALERRFTLMAAVDAGDAESLARLEGAVAAAARVEPSLQVLLVQAPGVEAPTLAGLDAGAAASAPSGPARAAPVRAVEDVQGLVAARYDLCPGTLYLFRPDQHVAARWRRPDEASVVAALRRASGMPVAAEPSAALRPAAAAVDA